MDSNTYIISAILSLLPISELRGAIPFALARGLPLEIVYPWCVLINALVGPIVFFFLSTVHRLLSGMRWYDRLFDAVVLRTRARLQKKVERFEYLGILLFVAIPLPITGAYTGTLGAWILGMKPKKTFLIVLAGVAVSGVIVSIVSLLGIEALELFTTHLETVSK